MSLSLFVFLQFLCLQMFYIAFFIILNISDLLNAISVVISATTGLRFFIKALVVDGVFDFASLIDRPM